MCVCALERYRGKLKEKDEKKHTNTKSQKKSTYGNRATSTLVPAKPPAIKAVRKEGPVSLSPILGICVYIDVKALDGFGEQVCVYN